MMDNNRETGGLGGKPLSKNPVVVQELLNASKTPPITNHRVLSDNVARNKTNLGDGVTKSSAKVPKLGDEIAAAKHEGD